MANHGLSAEQKMILARGCARLKIMRRTARKPQEEKTLWLKTVTAVIAATDKETAQAFARLSPDEQERLLADSAIFNFEFFSQVAES